jgi:hypothetical protein
VVSVLRAGKAAGRPLHLSSIGGTMNTEPISGALTTLLGELVDGPPGKFAFMLNAGDPGLLRSLDRLSPEAASASVHGGATVAAHVEHLRYGLSLMNRWTAGKNPFQGADWGAAWRTSPVSEPEWARLRAALADEAHRWLDALRVPREVDEVELSGVIGSIAHLAYHLGAIRQIDRTARGPAEGEQVGGVGGVTGEPPPPSEEISHTVRHPRV